MERRSEPRLSTDSPVCLQALRGSPVELRGTAIDVSARGLRILVPANFEPGEVVRVLADSYRTIAVVRYCQESGGQYVIGIERTDEWVRHAEGDILPDLVSVASGGKASQQLKTHFGDVRTAAIRDLFDEASKNADKKANGGRSKKAILVGAALGIGAIAAVLGGKLLGPEASLQTPASAASAKAAAALNPTPAPSSALPAIERQVSIHARANSWVLACADGVRAFERLVAAGETIDLTFVSRGMLRAGNAGGLDVTLDGEALGIMGPSGQPEAWGFTSGGLEVLAPETVRTCADY